MNILANFFKFLAEAYSESGSPSSSRILSTYLGVVASGILVDVFGHIIGISDAKILGIWLASVPLIVISLVVFFISPYAITKGSTTLKDLLDFLKGKKDE